MLLNINNEYCTSFEQLRSYFITLPEFGSNLYWELIESGRDQAISQWLHDNIGNVDMAHQLESIDDTLGDTDYLKEMCRIILGEKVLEDDSVQVVKPSFLSCFSLENVELEQTNEKNTVLISLKVLTPMVNENFELRLETGWGIQSWSINPFNSKVDEVLKHDFGFCKLFDQEFDCIRLYADNELLSKLSVKELVYRSLDKASIQDKSSTNSKRNHGSCKEYKYGMFMESSLTKIDLSNLETTIVNDMSSMFKNCFSLETLDLRNFDTSNVTDMNYMFANCKSLRVLDLSSFDTSKVTKMEAMFFGCSSLKTLDLSNFDTSKVTEMNCMFYECSSLEALDLSSFDTSKVTKMNCMFSGCSSLKTLDLSNFDTSKVTKMGAMFFGCSSLKTLDLSGFDTSNVTDMGGMFAKCSSLEALDLSGIDTSNVTDMEVMFSGCSSLKALDLSGFDISKVNRMKFMFSSCSSLSKLILKQCDSDTKKRITDELKKADLFHVEIVQ